MKAVSIIGRSLTVASVALTTVLAIAVLRRQKAVPHSP